MKFLTCISKPKIVTPTKVYLVFIKDTNSEYMGLVGVFDSYEKAYRAVTSANYQKEYKAPIRTADEYVVTPPPRYTVISLDRGINSLLKTGGEIQAEIDEMKMVL